MRSFKRLFLFLKCLIAVGLLALALNQAHWRDFVVSDGQSYSVLATSDTSDLPERILVAEGSFWWRQENWSASSSFESIENRGTVIHPGFTSSIQ